MDWLWVLLVALRSVSPSADDQWAGRLAELDQVREQAFATGDRSLLGRVYTRGSEGRRADAALIEQYRRRDGRVVGAELRVLSCRVVRDGGERVTLEVVDQLGRARVAWGDGTSTALPHDRPSRRRITVVRDGEGRWRIAEARQLDAD